MLCIHDTLSWIGRIHGVIGERASGYMVVRKGEVVGARAFWELPVPVDAGKLMCAGNAVLMGANQHPRSAHDCTQP